MFENIFFLLCRKNHTLFATWNKPADGDKTITGCVVGKPLIIVHKPLKNGFGSCYINPKSGTVNQFSGHHYAIGVYDGNSATGSGPSCFVCVPTATTVVLNIQEASADDCLYVYI